MDIDKINNIMKFSDNQHNNESEIICRLCYNESKDNIEIFSPVGQLYEFEKKISQYLHLPVII